MIPRNWRPPGPPRESADVFHLGKVLARLGYIVVRRGRGGWLAYREVEL